MFVNMFVLGFVFLSLFIDNNSDVGESVVGRFLRNGDVGISQGLLLDIVSLNVNMDIGLGYFFMIYFMSFQVLSVDNGFVFLKVESVDLSFYGGFFVFGGVYIRLLLWGGYLSFFQNLYIFGEEDVFGVSFSGYDRLIWLE